MLCRRIFAATLTLILFDLMVSAQVPVIVRDRNNLKRINEPVTLGIPFPKGALVSTNAIRLTSSPGNAVNAQFQSMARWNDSTIRWLKCDFQANVDPMAETQYNIEMTPQGVITTELKVEEFTDSIRVTTGPLKFIVHKKSFNLIERLWFDLNEDRFYSPDEEIIKASNQNSGFIVMSGTNTRFSSSKATPSVVSIEESGPMKAVIKISGIHSSNGSDTLLKYETRIYAFAGKAHLKVWHVYANGKSSFSLGDTPDPAFGEGFNKYILNLKLDLPGAKEVVFGQATGFPNRYTFSSGNMSLRQNDRVGTGTQMQYQVSSDGNVFGTGGRADGWAELHDNKWGMTASLRYFWQKYPKGITLHSDGQVEVELCPTPEFLWYAMGTGDEIFLDFHLPASDSVLAHTVKTLNKSPLFPHTSPKQYVNSYAFYDLLEGDSPYPGMKQYIQRVNTNHLFNVEDLGLYGNINYGDTPRDYFDFYPDTVDASVWGNNYYDWILSTIKLFCQTGDLRYTDIFVPGNFHFRETACFNTYEDDSWILGFSPAYSLYHRATGHFQQHYAENLWYYYYLTGDERSREIGLRAAESITDRQVWANDNVDCRMAYQRASTSLEAYRNTGQIKFLNNARLLLIDKIINTQDMYGLIGGVDFDNGVIFGEQVFMMGLYSEILWKYLKEDPVQDAITRLALLADFMDKYARINPGVESYWNFFSAPSDTLEPQADTLSGEAVVYWDGLGLIAGTYAYAYDLTGNIKYKNLALSLLDFMWSDSTLFFGLDFWSKASGQTIKNAIHAVAIVSDQTTGNFRLSPEVHDNYVVVFPNPSGDQFRIIFSNGKTKAKTIRLFNSAGFDCTDRAVMKISSNQVTLGMKGLPSGIYYYLLQTGEGEEMRGKLLKLYDET